MFNKTRMAQIAGVLVFTMAIGAMAMHVESGNDNCIDQTVYNRSVTAGVTAQLNVGVYDKTSVTAGVTSDIYDFNNSVEVAANDNVVVTASNDDRSAAERCGYDELAMSVIDEGNLNIRDKAATTGKIVGKMTNHNACEILGTDGEWTKVKSGNVKGYVKSCYIVTGKDAEDIAEEEVVTVATVENTQTLRVRKKASTEAKTVSLIGEGEDLVVVDAGSKEGWIKVEVDDDENGYVSTDYVSLSEKLPTAKSVTEISTGSGVSDARVSLVQFALQFVGNRYVWGGTSLTNGIDCSGFTMQVYARYGVSLPHHAASQPGYGTRISPSEARPGDLFFYGSGHISHVAIYIGNGQIVHAANARSGIKISSAYYSSPVCVVRYLN